MRSRGAFPRSPPCGGPLSFGATTIARFCHRAPSSGVVSPRAVSLARLSPRLLAFRRSETSSVSGRRRRRSNSATRNETRSHHAMGSDLARRTRFSFPRRRRRSTARRRCRLARVVRATRNVPFRGARVGRGHRVEESFWLCACQFRSRGVEDDRAPARNRSSALQSPTRAFADPGAIRSSRADRDPPSCPSLREEEGLPSGPERFSSCRVGRGRGSPLFCVAIGLR